MNSRTLQNDGILLESGTNEVEFMEFQLNDVSYGINVSKIQRLVALRTVKITKVAQAQPCVIGSIHNHGLPIKLLDLKSALAIENDQKIDPDRQLVMVTKFNGETTAFLIDSISKIHRISWKLFDPFNQAISSDSESSFSTGTITLEDRIIIILDLERLMLTYFPNTFRQRGLPENTNYNALREQSHIVYVEDSKVVRRITIDLLAKAGYHNVKFFVNGEDALRYIKENHREPSTQIDLVLTDIEMPMMDGLTLCRNVKALSKNDSTKTIPVVIYSSLITPEMSRKCQAIGADAELAKPEVEKIVQTIDQFCLNG